MLVWLQSIENLEILKNGIKNFSMYYSLIILFVVMVLLLIKVGYKLYNSIKGTNYKTNYFNFHIYKLLIIVWVVTILPFLLSIIIFIYHWTVGLLINIIWDIDWTILQQNHIWLHTISNNITLLLWMAILLLLLITAIVPFRSWKKLWKIWIRSWVWIVSIILIFDILSRIFS